MMIPFVKTHGLGNDFLLVENTPRSHGIIPTLRSEYATGISESAPTA